MKKILVAIASGLLVAVTYAALARTPEPARNPPVTLPRPDLPPENGSPKPPKEFPPTRGRPTNTTSP